MVRRRTHGEKNFDDVFKFTEMMHLSQVKRFESLYDFVYTFQSCIYKGEWLCRKEECMYRARHT